ncbi:MAG: type I methionyl aminopeptidase [Acidimicrobiales bacterium]
MLNGRLFKRRRSVALCWCGSGSPRRSCHADPTDFLRRPVELGTVSAQRAVPDHIVRPDYVRLGRVTTPTGPQIQTAESLERLRRAGNVAAEVLLAAGRAVAPGITTDELDAIAHDTYLAHGAYPSTLGYYGFPKSICTSVNGVICHGIPDSRPLEDGDIVNIDVTAYVEGMHGDTSATFAVGTVDEATHTLIDVTRAATLRGIAAIRHGVPLQSIAEAIEPYAASFGFGVVAEYGGHGIGQTFHTDPHVHHCVSRGDDTMLVAGMSLTVEPMLYSGRPSSPRPTTAGPSTSTTRWSPLSSSTPWSSPTPVPR